MGTDKKAAGSCCVSEKGMNPEGMLLWKGTLDIPQK
jgi:hypothetical protein